MAHKISNKNKKWLEELFETENCSECGRGAKGHDVVMVNGNPFARCRVK